MIKSADALTKFSAQLRNATSSQAEFGEAFDNVRRIASSAQAPIEAVGSTYARLSNALKDLNVTQTQLSDVAETVALG
jgi:methyl-accepting chemotaxis protein